MEWIFASPDLTLVPTLEGTQDNLVELRRVAVTGQPDLLKLPHDPPVRSFLSMTPEPPGMDICLN